MKHSTTILLLAALMLQAYAAPQFITFKDGKLGVNFMGYHAGVGIGGLLGGDTGAAGRLYAEAGTPTGQSARAGLGGKVDEQGRASGGLFAGATAGGNVQASAGLAGGVNEYKSEGGGFAAAQAGKHIASSGLGGQSAITGSSGFSYTSNNNVALPVYKEVHTTHHKIDAANEIKPLLETTANFEANVNTEIGKNNLATYVQPSVFVKEVYTQPKLKHHRRVKPGKTYISYVEEGGEPNIEKRIDIGAEGSASIDTNVAANAEANTNQIYTKQISVQRNPTFFRDIFNIPISALDAVKNFLGNAATNTNVSVQKTASINAETDSQSTSGDHSSTLLKSSQSSAHVSVETPRASQILDDIFAIPINTLGAVNRFLDNNVPARKTIQTTDGSEEIRLRGPARRRANKRVIITNQPRYNTENTDDKQ